LDARVARVNQLAMGDNPNQIFRRVLNEAHDTLVYDYSSNMAKYAGTQGLVLGLTRRVDAITSLAGIQWVHRNVTQKFARSFLMFLNYGPWNVLETQFRAWLGGVGFIIRPGSDQVQVFADRYGWILGAPVDLTPGTRARLEVAIGGSNRARTQVANRGLFNTAARFPGISTLTDIVKFPATYAQNIRAVYAQRKFLSNLSEVATIDYREIQSIIKSQHRNLLNSGLSSQAIDDLEQDILAAAIRSPDSVRNLKMDLSTIEQQVAVRQVGTILQHYPDIEQPFQDYIVREMLRGRWSQVDDVIDETWSSIQDHYIARMAMAKTQLERFTKEYIDTLGQLGPQRVYHGTDAPFRGRPTPQGGEIWLTRNQESAAAYGERVLEYQISESATILSGEEVIPSNILNLIRRNFPEHPGLTDDVTFSQLLGSEIWQDPRTIQQLRRQGISGIEFDNEDIVLFTRNALEAVNPNLMDDQLLSMFNAIHDTTITVQDVISQVRAASTVRARELTDQAARDIVHARAAQLIDEYASVVETDLLNAIDQLRNRAGQFNNPAMANAIDNVRERVRLITETRRADQAIFDSFRAVQNRSPRGADWELINPEREEIWNRYFQRDAELIGEYFTLTEGLSTTPPGALQDATQAGGLTPQHIGALFRVNGDTLSSSLVEGMTMMRKEKFRSMVMGKAQALASRAGKTPAEYGFTPEAVEAVYDQLIRSMRMDPDNLVAMEPIRQQLEGIRHELWDVTKSRRLQPGTETTINQSLDAVADDLQGMGIYRSDTSRATRTSLDFSSEAGYVRFGDEPLDPDVERLLNLNTQEEVAGLERARQSVVGLTEDTREEIVRIISDPDGYFGQIPEGMTRKTLLPGGDSAISLDYFPDHVEIGIARPGGGDIIPSRDITLSGNTATDVQAVTEAVESAIRQEAPRLRSLAVNDIRALRPGEQVHITSQSGVSLPEGPIEVLRQGEFGDEWVVRFSPMGGTVETTSLGSSDEVIEHINTLLSRTPSPDRSAIAPYLSIDETIPTRLYNDFSAEQLRSEIETLDHEVTDLQERVLRLREAGPGSYSTLRADALEQEAMALFNRLQQAQSWLDIREGVDSFRSQALRQILRGLSSEQGSITPDLLLKVLDYFHNVVTAPRSIIRRENLSWTRARELAMERTRLNYVRDFTDYTDDNIFDAIGKAIFPFWTYEAQRWPYLLRTAITHPGTVTAWGKYMNYSEEGYIHIPGTDVALNPFRGTILMGGFRGLLRDFPEYYENPTFNNLAGAMDSIARLGFFPGAHVMIPLGLGARVSGGSFSDFFDLPPVASTPMNLLSSLGVPYAEAFREILFPNRFRNFAIAQQVSKLAQNRSLDTNGARLLEKQAQGLPLTEEEQLIWDEASRQVSSYQILFEQSALFKLDIEERREANELAKEFIAKVTGISPEDQDAINNRLMGSSTRFSDLYPLDPISQQQLLEMDKYKYWSGISQAIYPSSLQRENARINQYWEEVSNIWESARTTGFHNDRGELVSLPTSRLAEQWVAGTISSADWQRANANIIQEAINRTDGLRASGYYEDVPITLEERQAWAERHGMPVPTSHPGQELIRMYYELQPRIDPTTGEADFDTYFAEVDALLMAMPQHYQEEFLTYIHREWTAPQKLYWQINRDYLRPYNNLVNALLRLYSEQDATTIERYRANEELRKTLPDNDPIEELLSTFDTQLTRARQNFRDLSPDVDAWLFFWGRTNTLRTDRAVELFNRYQQQHRPGANIQVTTSKE
jgi:hypothetical protein